MDAKDLLTESNPARYREFSEPMDREAAEAATKAFFEDVRAARLKHRIRDVHVMVKIGAYKADGTETTVEGDYHMGSILEAPLMLATALGRCRMEEVLRLLAYMGLPGPTE